MLIGSLKGSVRVFRKGSIEKLKADKVHKSGGKEKMTAVWSSCDGKSIACTFPSKIVLWKSLKKLTCTLGKSQLRELGPRPPLENAIIE